MKKEYYGIIGSDEIEINRNELRQRLGGWSSEDAAVIEECRKTLAESAVCRYSLVKTELTVTEDTCAFDTFSIVSRDLAKDLEGCREAWLMGVTLGPEADRLLARLKIKSPAKHFITDACASALVEALADKAEERARKAEAENKTGMQPQFRPRYSPGYGDCKIENQKAVLERLEAKEKLGISLDETFFMRPSKSITAIIGVKPGPHTERE